MRQASASAHNTHDIYDPMKRTKHTRKATSVDVARMAGVSQSAVSRAFSPDASVSDGMRHRVMKAARRLNYTPNAIARSLIRQKTHIVGLVMAGITSPYQAYVLEKLAHELQTIGRQALVFNAALGQEVDDILLQALQYQVEALIVTSATLASKPFLQAASKRTQVILFNRVLPGVGMPAVSCDNVAGGRTIADYFVAAGYKRMGFIAGNSNSSTNAERKRGFVNRLRRHGIADITSAQADYSYDAGYAAAHTLLRQKPGPQAVFCASDIIALGALDAARDLKLRVPSDVAVAGFDDIPMASWSPYQLTTIREPVDAMIDATLGLLTEPNAPASQIPLLQLFKGELVQRQSA